jgi:ligand-binding sensor domain-containing protein
MIKNMYLIKLMVCQKVVQTLSVSLDKSGDVWIGSDRGLRILSRTSLDNNPKVEPIIITQNGLAEELFKDSRLYK